MQRRALYLAASVATLAGFGCGSDGGDARGGSAGAPAGQSAGAASLAGAAGAGGSVAGASSIGNSGSAGASGGGGSSAAGGPAQSGGNAGGGVPPGTAGSAGAGAAPAQLGGTPLVYVGGFGKFPLRVYVLDKVKGTLIQRGEDADAGQSPSYLAFDPSGQHLYTCNEDNGATAGVTAHRVKPDGTLERLNHQQGSDKAPQNCDGSCGFTHLAVDPSGHFLLAASYDGGSVSVFPIGEDGALGAEQQLLDFGSKSEAHAISFDASGKFVFVPTLGLDRIQQLQLGASGNLVPNSPPNIASVGNAGPRHLALHPGGKWLFAINETASTVTSYAASLDGKLTAGASVSTLPAGFSGESYGQHVEVSPNGRFLYGSNVGHDSIAVFAVDAASGALTPLQDQPSGGAWPRDFDVDPNGDVLVVANRDSSTLNVFAIGTDGKLSSLGAPTSVPDQPSSVVIRYQK